MPLNSLIDPLSNSRGKLENPLANADNPSVIKIGMFSMPRPNILNPAQIPFTNADNPSAIKTGMFSMPRPNILNPAQT